MQELSPAINIGSATEIEFVVWADDLSKSFRM